jgi:hypothetical protein
MVYVYSYTPLHDLDLFLGQSVRSIIHLAVLPESSSIIIKRLFNQAMAWKMLYEIGIVWGAGMASPFERNK